MGQARIRESWVKPESETLPALISQIGFIRRSCKHYDEGHIDEATRLATHISTICVDGAGGPGLLSRLAAKRTMRFVDTAGIDETGNLAAWTPLVSIEMSSSGCRYVPQLGQGPFYPEQRRWIDWWERTLIYNDKQGVKLTRHQLVRAIRNQDGGAHFDLTLDDANYVAVSRGPSPYVQIDAAGNEADISNLHYAMVRAIAWELDESLVAAKLVAAAN